MQIRRSSFPPEASFPRCPFDHEKKPCLQRHGSYERFSQAEGAARTQIPRFLCVLTGRTLSVLPDDFLPYRAIGVPAVQRHFDAVTSGGPEDSQGDPQDFSEAAKSEDSEVCQGSLRRAWKRFGSPQRQESLRAFFGQRLPLTNSLHGLWQAMRHTAGSLAEMLLELARDHKSLLGDYQCLSPH